MSTCQTGCFHCQAMEYVKPWICLVITRSKNTYSIQYNNGKIRTHMYDLMQNRYTSTALAMELYLFCIKPSTWYFEITRETPYLAIVDVLEDVIFGIRENRTTLYRIWSQKIYGENGIERADMLNVQNTHWFGYQHYFSEIRWFYVHHHIPFSSEKAIICHEEDKKAAWCIWCVPYPQWGSCLEP